MNNKQLLEFQVNQTTLSGILTISDSGSKDVVVLLHPHPLYGGDMNNSVVMDLDSFFLQNEFTTFRFNFRGVSANYSNYEGIEGATQDGLEAIEILKNQGYSILGIAGYSFGGSVTLRLAISIPVKFAITLSASADLFLEDSFSFEELRKIDCPILMFHGTADQIVSFNDLYRISSHLRNTVRTVALPDEDHFYFHTIPTVYREVNNFISKLRQNEEL